MKDLKIIFMGTPSFAEPILDFLIKEYNVIMVVTQPDREKDRKGNIVYSPCKKLALDNNIEVYQPLKIREEYKYVIDKNPDIIITAAYGQIIPEEVLSYPRLGCINVHGSLLPKLRGGAPIHHAIINGDKTLGVTVMYMDKKMDAGDIISKRSITIGDNDILDDIYNRLSLLGRDLLKDTLPSIIDGTNDRTIQNEDEVTFGFNISKEEEKVNFNDSAINIHNHIRGLSTIPGAYAFIKGKRMKFYLSEVTSIKSKHDYGFIENIDKTGLYINTKDFLIKITDFKIEGKQRCNIKDFVNGNLKNDFIGARFE